MKYKYDCESDRFLTSFREVALIVGVVPDQQKKKKKKTSKRHALGGSQLIVGIHTHVQKPSWSGMSTHQRAYTKPWRMILPGSNHISPDPSL